MKMHSLKQDESGSRRRMRPRPLKFTRSKERCGQMVGKVAKHHLRESGSLNLSSRRCKLLNSQQPSHDHGVNTFYLPWIKCHRFWVSVPATDEGLIPPPPENSVLLLCNSFHCLLT